MCLLVLGAQQTRTAKHAWVEGSAVSHPALPCPLQAHTDLRAPPKAQYLSTLHGRASGPGNIEPGIVEVRAWVSGGARHELAVLPLSGPAEGT